MQSLMHAIPGAFSSNILENLVLFVENFHKNSKRKFSNCCLAYGHYLIIQGSIMSNSEALNPRVTDRNQQALS